MRKTILTATALACMATPVVQVEAKDTLASLTDSVNIATETLNNLVAQKERLEKKYSEVRERMENLQAGYDISDKDKLMEDTKVFLAEESEKANLLMQYNSLASNIEAETENTANQLIEQDKLISKLTTDGMVYQEEVEEATKVLEEYYASHEGIKEKVEDEAGFAKGMEHFVSKVAPDIEWKEEYPTYTQKQLNAIFEGYQTLKEKQPISLMATLKKSEALTSGKAYNATFLEDGRVFFGYANMDEKDPKDLDKKYEEYLKAQEQLTKELDKQDNLRDLLANLKDASKKVEDTGKELEEALKGKIEMEDKANLLVNLDEEIADLKATMASNEVIHEATLVQETLKDTTKESLMSTGYGLIENPVSEYGRRYNDLVSEGQGIYNTNEGLVVDYNDYANKLKVIEVQIASATKTKEEAEAKLEAYKKTLAKTEHTGNPKKETEPKQDKGLETGIGGMSILIPAGIGIAGITGLAITKGLRHKNKHR